MNTWIEFTTEMNVMLIEKNWQTTVFDAPLTPCDHATIKEHCYLAGIIPYSISFAKFSEQDKQATYQTCFYSRPRKITGTNFTSQKKTKKDWA